MDKIVRLGDTSSHGGSMITATGNLKVNDIQVCIDGDLHSCPIPGHGVTEVRSSKTLKSNSKSMIKTGCVAGCGAVITNGSPNTFTH